MPVWFKIGFMKSETLKIEQTVEILKQKLGKAPDIVIVLGSGLKDVDIGLQNVKTVDVSEITGWPGSTVEGHRGVLIKGNIGNIRVLLQVGRVHLYEGHSVDDVVLPVRSFIKWGASRIIFTNAAGGINEYLKPGMMMFIEDHLNLTGQNPLVGSNDNTMGQRFPDMGDAYSRNMLALLVDEASFLGIDFKIGVYAGMLGPSYETPAEVKMLRILGADVVGMSTVLEVIAAVHMGAEVAAISTVSNMAATYDGAAISHNDVQESASMVMVNLGRLLAGVIKKIDKRSAVDD